MKININKISIISIIIAVFAIPTSFAFAESQAIWEQGLSANVNTATPAVSGQNVSGASVANDAMPTVSGQNVSGASTATVINIPSVSGQNVSGASVAIPVPAVSGQNISGATKIENTSSNNSSNPNSNSGSSSSGGSSGGHRARISSTVTADCSYINSYIKIEAKNDVNEIVKLQTFLKNNEKMNVDVNGIYDIKTIEAVKAFQTKYANDILTPWGMKSPSGNVFYTTKKKINELICNKNLSLTSTELAQIDAYKKRINEKAEVNSNDSKSIIEKDTKNTAQTATVANTSFFGKTWKFVKWLFGY